MPRVRLFLATIIVLAMVTSADAQDDSKWLFNIGGGVGLPQGDLSSFVNNGGHFVVGGGYNFTRHFAVDTEFMWHDLPISSATKDRFRPSGQAPGNMRGQSIQLFIFHWGQNLPRM
jgi:Outer membrane protein beta-barrel domain